jgi:anthranilate synthase/indole-3-glycerol phosphate synthase/phosphoribosylanthranilate isomerase
MSSSDSTAAGAPPASKLQRIADKRADDVARDRQLISADALAAQSVALRAEIGAPLDLAARLRLERAGGAGTPDCAVMAEFKRASPSKGDIAVDLDAATQATVYAAAGAAVVSVLTEPTFFKGTLADMLAVRRALHALHAQSGADPSRRTLVLRKDFILDEYQLAEASAHGADTVLLMASILSPARLAALLTAARDFWGMEPLVEVISVAELDAALAAGARVVGINNRNLHTFEMDLGRTSQLASVLRARGLLHTVELVALSGITARADVSTYVSDGVGAVLVGEALMRSPDPAAAIAALRMPPAAGNGEGGGGRGGGGSTAGAGDGVVAMTVTGGKCGVKVCGVTSAAAAVQACAAGANFIGVIFAQKSPRCATTEAAAEIVSAVRAFGERRDRLPLSALMRAELAADAGAEAAAAPTASQWYGAWSRALARLRQKPLVVGVFMDQPAEEVGALAEAAGLDLIQLHGGETPEFASSLPLPTIKVLHVPAGEQTAVAAIVASAEPFVGVAAAVLLDTKVKGGASGGTGVAFDWKLAADVVQAGVPVMVAGGLTPANVAEAVRTALGAWAVDVASGVEASPGVKDPEKVRAFVANAKQQAGL